MFNSNFRTGEGREQCAPTRYIDISLGDEARYVSGFLDIIIAFYNIYNKHGLSCSRFGFSKSQSSKVYCTLYRACSTNKKHLVWPQHCALQLPRILAFSKLILFFFPSQMCSVIFSSGTWIIFPAADKVYFLENVLGELALGLPTGTGTVLRNMVNRRLGSTFWDRCDSRLVPYFPIKLRVWKEKFPAFKDIGLLPGLHKKSGGEPVLH